MSLPVRAFRRLAAACIHCSLPLALGGAIGLAAMPAIAFTVSADKAALPPIPPVPVNAEPTVLRALPATYAACSAQPNTTYTTSSTTFEGAVVECTLQAPTAGFIVAIGSGSLSLVDQAYEVNAQLTVDDAHGSQADRWVNVYPNASDGTDKSIALSQIVQVAAGPRRISFKARRYSGGEVRIFDPTLTAIFVPASAAQTVCGSAAGTAFRTQSGTLESVASCQISVAEDSIAFVYGTASMGYSLAPSEARVRLGSDGTWDAASDRFIDVYADDEDGTDESMATQFTFPVAAGTHTFDLYAARYGGSGEVTMYDPVLTVVAVPAASAVICSEQSNVVYINATATPTPIRACSLSTTTPAHALVFGSASIGRADPPAGGPYEGMFRLTTGGESLSNTERWIDIDNDAGDGTDRNLAVQWGTELDPGTHAFGLQGLRLNGSGEIRAYNAAIHVLMLPSDRLFHTDFELP